MTATIATRGNHVIVDCGDFHVEIAHSGSVRVAARALMSSGDQVGKVGNSGSEQELFPQTR
ncbi:M23 family metallopeptidase [Mesorhizobium sp. M1307]|uniref:hypothetical protein n=1 Tax=Mesorhizobium sp. M1307 TaxID=2957079 RepID=UPI003338D09A